MLPTSSIALLFLLTVLFVFLWNTKRLPKFILRWRDNRRVQKERVEQERLRTEILEERRVNEQLADVPLIARQNGTNHGYVRLDIKKRQ